MMTDLSRIVAIATLFVAPTYAQCVDDQDQKVVASDAFSGDQFASSLAADGNLAVVGAPGENQNQGSAYVFERQGGTWVETQKLLASNGSASDQFGFSVSVRGSVIAVGALAGSVGGAVYVYRRNGNVWQEEAILTGEDLSISDNFGTSVDTDEERILVGAPGEDPNGSNSGNAYVFHHQQGSWIEEDVLTHSSSSILDEFGTAVSIDGDELLVSAVFEDVGLEDTGAVYVFQRNGSDWTQVQQLSASDAGVDDFFGFDLDVHGDVAVIGAPFKSDGATRIGAAYVFRKSGGLWQEEQKLIGFDSIAEDRFGWGVSVFEGSVAIGAHGDDEGGNGSGGVFSFRYDGSSWLGGLKLLSTDLQTSDRFGDRIDHFPGGVLVSANGDDDFGSASGAMNAFSPPPIVLSVSPSTVPPGSPITFDTCRGTPGAASALFLIEVSGVPFFRFLTFGSFDAQSLWSLPGFIPDLPQLQNQTLTFRAFSTQPLGGLLMSENTSLVIQ